MAAEEENTTSFKSLGLCDQLVEAVAELQWKSPTPIQAEVLPPALQGCSHSVSHVSILFLVSSNPRVLKICSLIL